MGWLLLRDQGDKHIDETVHRIGVSAT
jgi:hypothetical protein